MASNSPVHIYNPPSCPSLAPTYSQISVVPISSTKRLISFAGQTGTGQDTEANKSMSFPEQVRRALEKLDKCLAAAGTSKKDIVMIRPYVVKLTSLSEENLKAREDIFMEWWRETEGQRLPPPDTLIGVDSLWSKETLFEIEVQCVADL